MSKHLKNIYFLFVLIVSMEGSMYYRTKEMMIFRITLSVFLMFLYKIKPNKKLIYALSVWFFFVLICFVFTSDIQPTALLRYWTLFIESFLLIRLFRLKLFDTYIKLMIIFSIISLFGWLLSLVSLSGLFSLLKQFDISGGFRKELSDYLHIVVFTLHNRVYEAEFYLPRNSGFCWEPGPFSILVVLAIYFNSNYKKKNYGSLSSIILIITLITTFSTTGLLIFMSYISYTMILKSRKPQYLILAIILIVGFVYSFNKLEFLGSKVQAYSEQEVYVGNRYGQTYLTGSRLAGLPLVLQDLYSNPLIGKGLLLKGDYDYFGSIYSVHLNAIFTILSSMGLFGLFWWFYFLIKSSLRYKTIFGLNEKYGFVLIVSAASFGFNLHTWSIMFCFVFFDYFYLNNRKDVELIKFSRK